MKRPGIIFGFLLTSSIFLQDVVGQPEGPPVPVLISVDGNDTTPMITPNVTQLITGNDTTTDVNGNMTTEEVPATAAPVVYTLRDGCYDDLWEVFNISANEDLLFIEKKFVLCPNTVFDVGLFIVRDGSMANGSIPLSPRSNTIVQCGEDGSSANNCVIRGGHYGLITVPFFNEEDTETNNILVKGITFEQQILYSVFLAIPGSNIVIEDCVFRNEAANGAIVINNIPVGRRNRRLLDELEDQYDSHYEALHHFYIEGKGNEYFDESSRRELQEDDIQYSTFSGCTFFNISQSYKSSRAENGVFTIRNGMSDVLLENNVFMDNQFGCEEMSPLGYGVRNVGSQVTLNNNCFVNNRFFGPGAVMMMPGSAFSTSNNYAPVDDDLDCDFVASFETEEDEEMNIAVCSDVEASVCSSISEALTVEDPIPVEDDCAVFQTVFDEADEGEGEDEQEEGEEDSEKEVEVASGESQEEEEGVEVSIDVITGEDVDESTAYYGSSVQFSVLMSSIVVVMIPLMSFL